MSDLLNSASLVMIPSGYKEDVVYSQIPTDGSGDLSFTRASNGTRINSAGLVEVCPWNLAGYSEDFSNAYWTKNRSSITANSTTAPNGTTTADSLIEDTANGTHEFITVLAVDLQTYSFSIYAKANTRSKIQLVLAGTPWATGGNGEVSFDLSTGAVISAVNGASGVIESVGNGWYRCTITKITSVADPSGVLAVRLLDASGNSSYTGNGTSGAYYWGAQLNIGSTAKPYFPTTDRLNVPRLTYQNGGGGCPSLLLEKQSTNLAIESEQLNLWNGANASVTANTSVSPDGTQNADNVNITATNGYWRRNPLTFANSTSYTASIFVKKSATTGTKTFGFYYNNNVGSPNNGTWNCVINLTNITATTTAGGTAGTGIPTILSTNIVDYGSGWYRVEVAFTTGSAAGNSGSEIGFEANGVVVDFLAWGAQLEAGAYATSYIPTLAASATRGADFYAKAGFGNTSTAGTLYYEFQNHQSPAAANGFYMVCLFAGSTVTSTDFSPAESISILNNGLAVEGRNDGYATTLFSITPAINATVKIALRYDGTNVVAFVNGVKGTVFSDTAVGAKNAIRVNNGENATHATKQLLYFPSALTDAQLIELTTL